MVGKLLGGGLTEAPFAYKDIELVMQAQTALVDVVGKFVPKIVKMDGTAPKPWRKTTNRLEEIIKKAVTFGFFYYSNMDESSICITLCVL